MSVSDLSASMQDYLKTIALLAEWSEEEVTPTRLAGRMGLKISTVSDAVRRLSTQGLVAHAPYGAITLTDKGRIYATQMVRRHRLIETFLVQVLGYSWDEVHDEAENLEHAVSDLMVHRIDEHLDHPTVDPHGDPIPSPDGEASTIDAVPLNQVEAGERVIVRRIDDSNGDLLKFCETHGIGVGSVLEVYEGAPFSDSLNVSVLGPVFQKNTSLVGAERSSRRQDVESAPRGEEEFASGGRDDVVREFALGVTASKKLYVSPVRKQEILPS